MRRERAILKVEFSPGTVVDGASVEMQRLADKLDVGVETSFNGIELYTFPGCEPDYAASLYRQELEKEKNTKGRK